MQDKLNKIIYLAIPYTFNPELSFQIANEVAAELMEMGHMVFSPISHSSPISKYLSEDKKIDHEFWMHQDLPILSRCDELYIVVIGNDFNQDDVFESHYDYGHKLIAESKGCTTEKQMADALGMPIKYYYYTLH